MVKAFYGRKSDKAWKRQLDKEVDALIEKQEINKRRNKRRAMRGQYGENSLARTVECSQCHRKMNKHTADQQIENKRENAPICVACIVGIPRSTPAKRYHKFR